MSRALVLLVVGALWLSAIPALADGVSLELNEDGVTLSGEETSGPLDRSRGVGTRPVARPSGPDRITTYDILDRSGCPPGQVGVRYVVRDAATGAVLSRDRTGCEPWSVVAPSPAPAVPAAPARPDVTAQQVRDAIRDRFPTEPQRWSPQPDGLTGMESWFWYVGETSMDLRISLITVDARVELQAARYCWDVDGRPGHDRCASSPGSEQQPAATHLYRTRGDYDVRLDVTWTGTFTVTGLAPQPLEVTVPYARMLHVREARSVPVSPDG